MASSKRRRRLRRRAPPLIRISLSWTHALILVIGIVIGFSYSQYINTTEFHASVPSNQMRVCFSPGGNCEALIVQAVESAKSEILVQAYSFTSSKIAEAMVSTAKRGVSVKVLCDKGQFTAHHSQIPALKKAGINVKVDKVSGLAHNKVIIIDGKTVLTGSYNWSNAANKRNSENLVVISNSAIAKSYRDNWTQRANF